MSATPTRQPTHYNTIAVIDLVQNNGESETLWKVETERRFPNALLVICHGVDFHGSWVMVPQDEGLPRLVEDYARQLRAEFPDRPIVLVCCNAKHHHLKIPGVFHALDDVWFRPDKDGNPACVFQLAPNTVGNIFEFVDD